ncbi:HP0495 family protein [Campylobacter gastrosuis]|uniref:DUF493 domain-containing protein n=1 Tax=Campylobacter gastrosuis TaxID=2974576 RepID=A0ABT7HQ47_9BACT|nr:DUF493 family protein [Campylobacter gastrosuis]MDL0089026.1 DUF493 domain-containing protein [Campylobacter gastrosuis]
MVNILDFDTQKPKIQYPLFWQYKVIFDINIDVKDVVKEILGDREHKISFSKFSKDKKYQSYEISVFVLDERERLEIFSALKHVSKYVL